MEANNMGEVTKEAIRELVRELVKIAQVEGKKEVEKQK